VFRAMDSHGYVAHSQRCKRFGEANPVKSHPHECRLQPRERRRATRDSYPMCWDSTCPAGAVSKSSMGWLAVIELTTPNHTAANRHHAHTTTTGQPKICSYDARKHACNFKQQSTHTYIHTTPMHSINRKNTNSANQSTDDENKPKHHEQAIAVFWRKT
jgi:hypothetical protein